MHLTLFQHKYMMGQDSRIYESLFSTPKQGYKSLIDIYLEETGVAAPIPPLPRQQVATPSLTPIIPFNKNAEIAPAPWNEIAARLFGHDPKGTGRGEYSVAYLLTGLTTVEEIEKAGIIGGKSESVDVTVPVGQYEVKEIGAGASVKTGTHNSIIIRIIRKAVEAIVEELVEAYDTLSDEHQRELDNYIARQTRENFQLKLRGSPKNRNEAISILDKRLKDWTLRKYIRAILDKENELPKGMVRGDAIDLGRYEEKRPEIVLSIPQLVGYLGRFAAAPVAPTNRPAVTDIANVLYKYYGKTPEDLEFFKRKAAKIDVDTSQHHAKELGKKTDLEFFRRKVHSMNLTQLLREIDDAFSSKGLQIIFPHDGVFLVTRNDYVYVPRHALDKYLEIDTVSGGAVKVRRIDAMNQSTRK
jgi:hypothetical protein